VLADLGNIWTKDDRSNKLTLLRPTGHTTGHCAENTEKSLHTDFNEDTINETASVAQRAVKAEHSERMKQHVLTPLR